MRNRRGPSTIADPCMAGAAWAISIQSCMDTETKACRQTLRVGQGYRQLFICTSHLRVRQLAKIGLQHNTHMHKMR